MFVATVLADTTEKDAPDPTQKVGTVTSKAELKSLQEDIINHRLKISAKENKDWAHRISTPLIQEKKRKDKLKAQKKAKKAKLEDARKLEKMIFDYVQKYYRIKNLILPAEDRDEETEDEMFRYYLAM